MKKKNTLSFDSLHKFLVLVQKISISSFKSRLNRRKTKIHVLMKNKKNFKLGSDMKDNLKN
jgi:hypothetical protein